MYATLLTGPSIDDLTPATLPDPRPQRGEILIRQRAASLNFIDLAVATGAYHVADFPLIPVADGAGEVVAVGEGVTLFQPGDRAVPHAKLLWRGGRPTARNSSAMRGVSFPGSLAEYVAIPEDSAAHVPTHLDWTEAASLPIVATTAWRALKAGEVGPGAVVVLLGTGGVSIIALQLAKAAGARVIITSSSDEKLARARTLGADETINYRATPDWDAEVLRLTDGLGADLVVETGGGETLPRSINATAPGGTIFQVGFLAGAQTRIELLPLIVKCIRLQGSNTGPVSDFLAAMAAISAHRITPVVDKVFALDGVAQAYRHMASGAHFGKIAIAH